MWPKESSWITCLKTMFRVKDIWNEHNAKKNNYEHRSECYGEENTLVKSRSTAMFILNINHTGMLQSHPRSCLFIWYKILSNSFDGEQQSTNHWPFVNLLITQKSYLKSWNTMCLRNDRHLSRIGRKRRYVPALGRRYVFRLGRTITSNNHLSHRLSC